MRPDGNKIVILTAAFVGLAGTVLLPLLTARFSPEDNSRTPKVILSNEVSLDVVIPAYLEAGVIAFKLSELRSSFSRTAVRCRSIVIASDGATADAARDAGADHVILTGREGKAKAINVAVSQSRADLVALTDANCTIEPIEWVDLAIDELSTAHLVSAEKIESGGDEGLLRLLDGLLRRGSSGTKSSLGIYGEFVIFRRKDFESLPERIILDDVALGLSFAQRSLKINTTSVIRTVEAAASRGEQWERRLRIAEGLLTESLSQLPQLLKFPAGRIFAAHKLYRVSVGPACFWTAIAVMGSASPTAALSVAFAVPVLVLGYAGKIPLPGYAGPLAAVFGLHAVPLVAATRALRLGRKQNDQGALWKKISR